MHSKRKSMQLGWIDFSKEDRQKTPDVINLPHSDKLVENEK